MEEHSKTACRSPKSTKALPQGDRGDAHTPVEVTHTDTHTPARWLQTLRTERDGEGRRPSGTRTPAPDTWPGSAPDRRSLSPASRTMHAPRCQPRKLLRVCADPGLGPGQGWGGCGSVRGRLAWAPRLPGKRRREAGLVGPPGRGGGEGLARGSAACSGRLRRERDQDARGTIARGERGSGSAEAS